MRPVLYAKQVILRTPCSFPPKNAKVTIQETDTASLSVIEGHFPCSAIAQSNIWDTHQRDALKRPKFKKKDIDNRKSAVCTYLPTRCLQLMVV